MRNLQVNLLVPDFAALDQLVSWDVVVNNITNRSELARAAFVEQNSETGAGALSSLGCSRIPTECLCSENELSRIRVAIMVCLLRHKAPLFVLNESMSGAVTINPEVINGSHAQIIHPINLALTGRFVVTATLVAYGSIEFRLSGMPIMLNENDARKYLGVGRRSSPAEAKQLARREVERFQLEHPDEKMLKVDFKRHMRRHLSGWSDAGIEEQLWISGIVPASWHDPGRRRRR